MHPGHRPDTAKTFDHGALFKDKLYHRIETILFLHFEIPL